MAVYTYNYVGCGRVIKISCIGIMAASIPIKEGVCVKHNDTDARGIITEISDEKVKVMTGRNMEDTWFVNKITPLNLSDMRCYRLAGIPVVNKRLFGSRPSSGGKRKTRRNSRKMKLKSRKNRKSYKNRK